MFELNKLLSFGKAKFLQDQKVVLATIVATEGSTYRKRGTQMIISEDLAFEGAISGGCVEKEVIRQATTLFNGGPNITFEYDGRYKLGCNGKLYILLELLDKKTFSRLLETAEKYEKERKGFYLGIYSDGDIRKSYYRFDEEIIDTGKTITQQEDLTKAIEIDIYPQNQIIIIGSEYDAILLAKFSSQAGFKTSLIGKDIHPSNYSFTIMNLEPGELIEKVHIDQNSAVVIMTHSYSRDLHFLKYVTKNNPGYLGILGPADRRDRIISELMELEDFELQNIPDQIYAPIGLDIGASLPEEISLAILSEIISVFRNGNGNHLKDRQGSIHMEKS